MPEPVLIAGGGIGGLALALALAKMGRRSTVLEQRDSFGGAGAGIQLGPNGVRVLQRLGLAEAMRPAVGVPDALAVHHGATGRTLAVLPLGRWIAARHGAPYWVVHRADLHEALVEACRATGLVGLRVRARVDRYEQDANGVTVILQSGEQLSGCALIGADGLRSHIRRQVVGDGEPIVSGHTTFRSLIPTEHHDAVFEENARTLFRL